MEHGDGSVAQRARLDAGLAKVEARLVLGSANRIHFVRAQLDVA